MHKVRLDRSMGERQEQINTACQLAEEEARKQVQNKRRSWVISSEFLPTESEDDKGVLGEHTLRRG